MMMDVIEQLATRIARLEEKVHQLAVRGIVTRVDGDMYRVKVRYPAQDDVESGWLQVLTPMSHLDKVYTLPDIDEQVLVINLPGSPEVGYVFGTSYSELNPPPPRADSPDITMLNIGNGSFFWHNRKTGDLEIQVEGSIIFTAGKNIRIGAEGYLSGSAKDDITFRTPANIVLGEASEIHINAKDSTNITGSKELNLTAQNKVNIYGTSLLEVKSDGDLKLDGYLSYLSGTIGTHVWSQGFVNVSSAATSVSGTMSLLLGAARVDLSGIFWVQMMPVVNQVLLPVPAESADAEDPGVGPGDLAPPTVPDLLPIEPEPYDDGPVMGSGGAPPDPGPEEGPLEEPIIKEGGAAAGGKKRTGEGGGSINNG